MSSNEKLGVAEERVLSEVSEPKSISDLIIRLKPNADERMVRKAVWDLIDQGKVILTIDRKLTKSSE